VTQQIRVVAAVIRRGDTLLVCQRPTHKRHGGLWEFPGGKCENGESDETAIRRELREELNVEPVSIGRSEFEVADAGSPYLIAFIPVTIEVEPRALEHSALVWAPIADLLAMPLAPSDRRYVEWLGNASRY
jgi:ADP-ribose pyrophosphatase